MFGFFFNVAFKSIYRQKEKFLAITIASAIGAAIIASMFGVYLDLEGKVAQELVGFGANIEVASESSSSIEIGGVSFGGGGAHLAENDLLKLKNETTFWKNNIVNIVPFLYIDGEVENKQVIFAGTWFLENVNVENNIYTFGLAKMFSWNIDGKYPEDNEEVLFGEKALKEFGFDIGDEFVTVLSGTEARLKISGTVRTGGVEDYLVFLNLGALQNMAGMNGHVSKAYVRALVKPNDDLALKAERYGPESLSPEEFEKWYCSPYISAIMYNIEEVIQHADVKEVRKFSELQAGLLKNTSAVFGALTSVAFLVSIIGISSAAKMYLNSRKREIGIMKAIGSTDSKIISQFLVEMLTAAIVASLIGYILSLGIAGYLGSAVFSSEFQMGLGLFWIVFGVSIMLSILTIFLLRNEIKKLDPVRMMR